MRQRRVAELVSHQLRTPLTIVRSGLAILDDAPHLSASARREVMADVRQETERLVRVVDDLIVLLAPEAPPRSEPILLQRVLPVELAGQAGDGARTVEARLDDTLPPVSGDRDRLIHLVRNLIATAAQADPEGRVRLDANQRGARSVELVIRPTDDVAALPEPDDATALSLRSARRIASAMGGRLTVRRRHGPRLTLRLPVAADA